MHNRQEDWDLRLQVRKERNLVKIYLKETNLKMVWLMQAKYLGVVSSANEN
jgi:Trm5-related predicted tRNA methylase